MITLQLGDVTFSGFEIPDRIPFGGEQMLSLHQLVGGARVIDAMGRSDAPLEWAGRFRGSNAVQRARLLDAMRIGGKAQTLTWGGFSYTVIVQRFTGVFEQAFEVPYTISCLVVSDDAQPVDPGQGPSVDDMMSSDAASAVDMGSDVGDDGLSGLLGTMQSSVSAVPSFATASRETIAGVVGPIGAVQTYVGGLISANQGPFGGSSFLGGVVPGQPASASVAALAAQSLSMGKLPTLYDINSLMGRMLTNLAAVNASGSRQVVAGGDLYHLAASAYGDPNEWPTIAVANGLTDPVIAGIQTILIPPSGQGANGVLQP